MTYLSKQEMINVLRECVAIAKARRQQYNTKMLPLKGDIPEGESSDVISMLQKGQLVALSATFVHEIINHLGDKIDSKILPTSLIKAGAVH